MSRDLTNENFEHLEVSHENLKNVINEFWDEDISVFLLGPPGIGKSEMMAQVSAERNAELIDLRLSQLDPTDMRGLPAIDRDRYKRRSELKLQRVELLKQQIEIAKATAEDTPEGRENLQRELSHLKSKMSTLMAEAQAAINEGERNVDQLRVSWAVPDFFPEDSDGRYCLFIDELNTGQPAVQNTGLQLLNQKRIGPHVLPEDTYIAAAGNRKEDAAHVVPMSAPLRNRMYMLHVETPSLSGWTNWAMNNGVNPLVTGFIRFKPDMLYQPPVDQYSNFPTPRSWAEQISTFVNNGQVGWDLFEGAVGEGAAQAFMAYVEELKDMPDIDDLLNGRLPEYDLGAQSMSIQYAVVTSLVQRCKEKPSLLSSAMGIAKQVDPEHTAIFVSNLLNTDDVSVRTNVVANPEIIQWSLSHKNLIRREGANPNKVNG